MRDIFEGGNHDEAFKLLQSEIQLLRKEKIKLNSILEYCPANIVITDLTGKIQYTNPDFYRLTGYGPDEVLGKNPRLLNSGVHPREFYQELWKTITSGNVWQGEFYNRKKNGEYYWERAHIAPLMDDEGEAVNFVAIKFEITKQKEAEIHLNDLIQSKDKLLSIISHDLKSPFGSIVGLTDIVLENITSYPPEEIKKIFALLNSSSRQALELLDNMLIWARSQTGKIKAEPTGSYLYNIVDEVINSCMSQAVNKNIQIHYSVDANLMVLADANWTRTILRNLVSNAIKFTKRNGEVSISVEAKLKFVEISITDTGIGISQEDLEKLFHIERSLSMPGTDNERGTGLGLLLCQEFVEKQGGKIWVESALDKGSKFTFSLPKYNIKS